MLSTALFPPPLPEGGTIGLVAPSRWPKAELVAAARAQLEARGYRVKIHDQVGLRAGTLAGPDKARAAALRDMFLDPEVDAVMAARGGSGALQILDLVDYAALAAHPKPLIGFSDVTALLQAVTKKTGLVTYHGPMGVSFAKADGDPRTLEDLLAVLTGRGEKKRLYEGVRIERAGDARGRLVGGNLTMLQSLIGTAYDWSGEGAILMIEEVGEYLYRLDRMMAHLRLAGKLEGVRAVMVGEIADLRDEDPRDPYRDEIPYGKTTREIMCDHLPAGVPVVFDFPCGHGRYLTALPIGAEVALSLREEKAEVAFAS